MTTLSVSKQIKTAMADAFITKAEAETVVKEAEKGRLTVGEGKAIADLFDRGNRELPPGMMVTLAIPEHPGDVVMEAGANIVLNAFFAKHAIPAGAEKKAMLERIDSSLAKNGWGTPLASAPNVKKLYLVRLPYPEGVADYPTRNAFVDVKKGEFYLSVSGGLVAPGVLPTRWYGPNKLGDTLPKGLRETLEANARSIVSRDAGFALTRSDAVLVDTIKPNSRGNFDVVFKVAHFLSHSVRARLPIEVDACGRFVAAG
ncbi:MAG: hypothetical protein A2138_19480 [Deltaproteobacteria bacterium RBG_16_71_12]|nr:MAG: hypothetical protein A2138_19480 [Deltaproteobacteria bacterium RBG_16_71_12]